MIQDYKHLRDPKPVKSHPTILESMAVGIITGIVGIWIMWYALVQATGGL